MDWLKRLAFNAVKGKLKKRIADFRWSSREVGELRDKGFSDAEIIACERVMRVGGVGWLERQVK